MTARQRIIIRENPPMAPEGGRLCFTAPAARDSRMGGHRGRPMPAGKPHNELLQLCLAVASLLSACAEQPKPATTAPPVTRSAYDTPALGKTISKTAKQYNVPAALVHRAVERESSYNPRARNGPYLLRADADPGGDRAHHGL